MNLQERYSPKTEIKALDVAIPYVVVSKQALVKMFHYIDLCADEIGWLGTVYQDKNCFFVDDVFLFDQEVHSTTTEITPEGLSEFGTELLEKPNGIDIWNNMRLWGHSHVNMGVSPSFQDDKQMETFKDGGHPWFIRLIGNKKGEVKIDLYHYEYGIIYNDVPWEQEYTKEENELMANIIRLEKELERMRKVVVDGEREHIKAEMGKKVRKKYGNNYAHQSNWTQKSQVGFTTDTKTTELGAGDKKKESEKANGNGRWTEEDYLEHDADVYHEFSYFELLDLAKCSDLEELNAELEVIGWFNIFTESDLKRIQRVALEAWTDYYGDGEWFEYQS